MSVSAECVPRARPGFYKAWWNDALTDLKNKSIDAHQFWLACGSPRQGDVFMEMESAKIEYQAGY